MKYDAWSFMIKVLNSCKTFDHVNSVIYWSHKINGYYKFTSDELDIFTELCFQIMEEIKEGIR